MSDTIPPIIPGDRIQVKRFSQTMEPNFQNIRESRIIVQEGWLWAKVVHVDSTAITVELKDRSQMQVPLNSKGDCWR